jgi:hypothetical protein
MMGKEQWICVGVSRYVSDVFVLTRLSANYGWQRMIYSRNHGAA